MTFGEANILADRICAFILSCGGIYAAGLTAELQRSVFLALGSQQYVLKEENGGIVYFASYWKISPDDVINVMARKSYPADISHGTVLYITEAVCKGGKQDTFEMVRRVRKQAAPFAGVFWHRPAKKDRICNFPRQKGKGDTA